MKFLILFHFIVFLLNNDTKDNIKLYWTAEFLLSWILSRPRLLTVAWHLVFFETKNGPVIQNV